jgi:hypothetical protein
MTLELTNDPHPGLLQRVIRWVLPRAARFDRYDEACLRILFRAREAVSELGGRCIKPEHLLIGLLSERPEVVLSCLNPNVSLEGLVKELRDGVTEIERVDSNRGDALMSVAGCRIAR